MKILFLTNSLGTGGIETNLVRLTKGFQAIGHEVVIAARDGVLTPRARDAGARFFPLEVRLTDIAAVRRDIRILRRLIRNENPDIIHVFSASTGALLRLSSCPLRGLMWGDTTPVVSSIMGLVNHPNEMPMKSWIRNGMTVLGSIRILNSAPAIEAAVRRLPIRRSRFVRQRVHGIETWNGRKPDGVATAKKDIGVPNDRRLVVTIGRLDPTKSHDRFIHAAARVLKKRDDARFVIIGGGPLHTELLSLVEDLGLDDRVLLLGERHDVSRILAASDVCVRPGIVEGFVGLTVLEAQSLGIPVVAFETKDVKLAIRHEETGLLVPPTDVDALAAAVVRLLDDPSQARRIGAAGKTHMERTFALDNVVRELEARYRFETGQEKGLELPAAWE